MPAPPPRVATLVLVNAGGEVLGALPPFEADTPWWMDVRPVVRAAHERHGLHVTVLRLLSAQRPSAHGGGVTYLAQIDRGPVLCPLLPWADTLTEHPLRLPHARVGGPQADLAWARTALESSGNPLAGEPEQVRTWNLSSLWRLPTGHGGEAWLKTVPPFFAHEGAMLEALAGMPVPRLLARDGCRMLLAHVPGEDRMDAPAAECLAMIDRLVGLQQAWLGRTDELRSLGLPDWRGPAFVPAIAALVERRRGELGGEAQAALGRFVADLPARFEAITRCGMPDGLVHGDFHPGNVRSDGRAHTLLDWGDCGIGQPLLDQPAFLDRIPPAAVATAQAHWAAAWRRVLPAADIDAAAHLLAPIASARQALIYQRFLDGIEDAEHPYHRADVVDWLNRTASRLR